MSQPSKPWPAQLILSVLSSKWADFWPELLDKLKVEFGTVDYVSKEFEFTETNYYDQELGRPITRLVLGFEELKDPEELARIKLKTNILEQEYSLPEGRRVFNLDPGFLFLERLVLATGKNFTHRIYLAQGIWADLTLVFEKGDWKSLPWTYPDYASTRMQDILTELRQIYKKKLTRLKERNKKDA